MRARALFRALATPGRLRSQLRDALMYVYNAVSWDEFAQNYRRIRSYTMSGDARLRGLFNAVRSIKERGVHGDVVECGTARGGSAALLGLSLRACALQRRLWLFDTFEGIPAPTAADPDFELAVQFTGDFRGELEEVRALFARLDIARDVQFIKGRFEDTLAGSAVKEIALLHIDGDWYQSVKTCLDYFYDRVSPGGVIQIDDYGHWEGAKRAVDEFFQTRGIAPALTYLDYTGRQMIKP